MNEIMILFKYEEIPSFPNNNDDPTG